MIKEYNVFEELTNRSSVPKLVGEGGLIAASAAEIVTSSVGGGIGSSSDTFVSSEGGVLSSCLYVSINLSGYS